MEDHKEKASEASQKDCFGSIQVINLPNEMTRMDSKPECRTCQEFRDCLRLSKEEAQKEREREELRKQTMIAQIIDISVVFSNELGSCLLEFLNRIYNSSLGNILFSNLLLFYEIPKEMFSTSLTIPISKTTLDLVQWEIPKKEGPSPSTHLRGSFTIRVVLIQKYFQNNRKGNIGLIAQEVARVFSTDENGIRQICETLDDSERALFKKMDEKQRVFWLLEKWGFKEELESLQKELSPPR